MTHAGDPIRILLVDDDNDILLLLARWLKQEGFEVIAVTSAEEALKKLAVAQFNLVISDLIMRGKSGMDLLAEIHGENPLLPVIMLSGQATIPDAVQATHLGSSAFLTKPVAQEALIDQIRRALRLAPYQPAGGKFGKEIIYRSKTMSDLVELAGMVADSDVTVLITGATGTGKEVVARAIHHASRRADNQFVAVNCGAIPEQLLESELFGHEKGAFTGANTRHEGLFQAAHSGTLFLDEIGDMPHNLQVKLLRVLQDLQVRPVGSTKTYPVDVRIISATHRDLGAAVENSEFREDLYYRLKVVSLAMPSLSERREDIPLLAAGFLRRHAKLSGQPAKHFAPAAMEYLMTAPWPGNVRQLMNVVDSCVALCKSETIPLGLVQKTMQDQPGGIQTLKEAKNQFERNYLLGVLRLTNGHVANAARMAGRNRTEFYKLLNQHHIDPADFRRVHAVADKN
jgi:two-component system response regulator GlrR